MDRGDEWRLDLTRIALGVLSALSAATQPPSQKKRKENQEDPEEAYLARPLLAVEEDNLLHK